MHVKKGQTVIVMKGKDAGKSGEVIRAFPKTNKIVVAGINKMKKHQRARRVGEKGTTVEKEIPIDASNVKIKE